MRKRHPFREQRNKSEKSRRSACELTHEKAARGTGRNAPVEKLRAGQRGPEKIGLSDRGLKSLVVPTVDAPGSGLEALLQKTVED